jgi:alpha-tubulin suppressor-like RCC1 family protein
MPVSVDKLVAQANARIALGGQDAQDTVRLVGIANAVDAVYSVPTTADLPPAADNTGRMIHVADLNVYRYSNGFEWTNDYDTNLVFGDKTLLSWGRGCCGTIGDGGTTQRLFPTQEITSSTNWVQTCIRGGFNVSLKEDGTLWGWGENHFGQIGDNSTVTRTSPVQEITSSTSWCCVSGGYLSTMSIKTDGTLWGWGFGSNGVTALGITVQRSSPVQEISSSTNWCTVSAAINIGAGIKTDGSLWAWGYNGCGAFGDGTTVSRCSPVQEISLSTNWSHVSTGRSHSAAVKTNGTFWSAGSAVCGALGDGTIIGKCSPVQEISSSTNWCSVSASELFSSALKTDGTIWAWGKGHCGTLGSGTNTSRSSPVQEFYSATDWCFVSAGFYRNLAIKTNSTLWGWGCNQCGALGDGTSVNKCSPVQEQTSSTTWCAASASAYPISAGIKIEVVKGFNEI